MENLYSRYTVEEISKMSDSERINNLFTVEEIKELDCEFDSYLVISPSNLGYLGSSEYKFKSTGRVIAYVIDGICEIVGLSDEFICKTVQSESLIFTCDELVELKLRFGRFEINQTPNCSGFRKLKLGTGKEIWYVTDNPINIVNVIEPVVENSNIGMKFDDDKLLCMAFPAKEYKQILEVLTNGAKKYKIDNWKHVDDARNRYMNGLERHFLDYKEAVQTGNEELKFDNGEGGMGTPHLANLICNAIFLMYFDNNGIK